MTHHKRNVSGVSSSSGGLKAQPSGERVNQPGMASYTRLPRPWEFWITHRQGPFMVHKVEDCDPKAMGCHNTYDNLIEQGFMPCPKCFKGGD